MIFVRPPVCSPAFRPLGWLCALLALGASAAVVTYPAPPDEPLSADYQVQAAGQRVDVYTARTLDPPFAGKEWDFGGPYSFANFDLSGEVEVRITSKRPLSHAVIRPAVAGVKTRLEGDNTLLLTLPGPCKLSVEPDGKKGPLLLFANPLEANRPATGGARGRLLRPRRAQAGQDRADQ